MNMIRSICVYCGSNAGNDPSYLEAACSFGKILAEHDIGLVYGGGSRGLMGALAGTVHDNGGRVVGIIPEFLRTRERMFTGADEIIVTQDMHERKRLMFERADAFVALPGGIGTTEELVEQMTWSQLGRHRKPILMANIKGFWNPLIELLDHMKRVGFIHSGMLIDYRVVTRVEDILPELEAVLVKRPEEERVAGAAEVIEKL